LVVLAFAFRQADVVKPGIVVVRVLFHLTKTDKLTVYDKPQC
jgi:hypothetical protein